jgi:hypothetical protein
VKPHLFDLDPDVPADHLGRAFCRCGVVRLPGDPRHTPPDTADAQAAHLRWAGEREDEES